VPLRRSTHGRSWTAVRSGDGSSKSKGKTSFVSSQRKKVIARGKTTWSLHNTDDDELKREAEAARKSGRSDGHGLFYSRQYNEWCSCAE
jgi:hypothetical protein